MLLTCRRHGLVPIVTFHHFTSPRWLLAQGGWEDGATPELFGRYCDVVMQHLGDLIGVACTLNEPNLPYLLDELGIGGETAEERARVPMWAAAASARHHGGSDRPLPVHRHRPGVRHQAGRAPGRTRRHQGASTGSGRRLDLANTDIQAAPGWRGGRRTCAPRGQPAFPRGLPWRRLRGLQTYGRTIFGADGVQPAPDGATVDQMGEEIYPEALEATIREAWRGRGHPDHGHRERSVRPMTTPSGWRTCRPPSPVWPAAWPTTSTSVVTSPGAPSTTSSGSSATCPSSAHRRRPEHAAADPEAECPLARRPGPTERRPARLTDLISAPA